jgi:serine/threonine-protein kinase
VTASLDHVDAGVQPGDVLVGKYRVERVLGVGGMGVVVAAHHLQLDEKVALKFLRLTALGNAEWVARFDREARALVKIKSEHVARVIDVGKLENGAPYMVMEYLEGADLDAWLQQRGLMSVEQATEFLLQACEAIAEAHALGIVHRDLKPANLFCVRRADGLLAIKVLDFGISKMTAPGTSSADLGMTQGTAAIGSPLYMSPEQIQSSRGVDARTDLWSLGVILFELVTGRLPFEAETVTELAVHIATAPSPSPRSFRADLPEGFERVVMRCLEKDRDRRFQNVAELAVALRDFGPARARSSVDRVLRTVQASGASQGAPLVRADVGEAYAPTLAAVSGETSASWGSTRGIRKRRKDRRILVGAVASFGVLLALGGVGAIVARSHSASSSSPPSSAGPGITSATLTAPVVASSPVAALTAAPSAAMAPTPVASATPPAATAPATAPRAAGAATHAPPSASVRTSAVPPGAKPSCDPPYFIDSVGHRQYKPECL